jgi:hypothetical protein
VEYGAIQSLANGIAAGSAVEEYKRDDGACVGQFPVSYACLVSIKVTIPMPAAFTVTAKYNLEDGHVAETKLDNLQMVLSDLFLPVDISTFSEELQQVLFCLRTPFANSDSDHETLIHSSLVIGTTLIIAYAI